jgi:hypothetical protein
MRRMQSGERGRSSTSKQSQTAAAGGRQGGASGGRACELGDPTLICSRNPRGLISNLARYLVQVPFTGPTDFGSCVRSAATLAMASGVSSGPATRARSRPDRAKARPRSGALNLWRPQSVQMLRLYRAIATMDASAPLPRVADQEPTWAKASELAPGVAVTAYLHHRSLGGHTAEAPRGVSRGDLTKILACPRTRFSVSANACVASPTASLGVLSRPPAGARCWQPPR